MADESTKRYWKSLEERDGDAELLRGASDEFPGLEAAGGQRIRRRDFLKAAGFGAAVAGLAGCSRAPVEKAIPFLVQPEEIVPGRALMYATTCAGCAAGCGVLAKVRDGRPIKLEGNPEHPLSRGGLCAVGQASILGLYDSQRLLKPLKAKGETDWAVADREIVAALDRIRAERGAVRFLTGTITSPTQRAAIAQFLARFADARHIEYDPFSHSAILDAHQQTHGARLLPHFRFERAEVIMSLDADFLGTWLSPVEFTARYRAGRDLMAKPPRMSWHVQFESRMSLTGSKADRRVAVAPEEIAAVAFALARGIATKSGSSLSVPDLPHNVDAALLHRIAERLWRARGKSLVVCGSNDLATQLAVNALNQLLGNYGSTLELNGAAYARGSDAELVNLLEELEAGKVRALLVAGANPAFDLPGAEKTLRRAELLVSFSPRLDETAVIADYVAPEPHYLESWNDAESVAGLLSITQPTINRLGESRPLCESLASWSGTPRTAYDIVREHWRAAIHLRAEEAGSFDQFWDQSVHDGFVPVAPHSTKLAAFEVARLKVSAPAVSPPAFTMLLYPKVGMLAGEHAYNPWLHELPDPVTKVTWDNYACLSPAAAKQLGVSEGDVVRIATDTGALELPAYIQPGQHDRVVAVALGYGSKLTRRFADIGPQWMDALPSVGAHGLVGKNAAAFVTGGNPRQYWRAAQLKKTGERHELASTQKHHMLAVPAHLTPPDGNLRPIVQETTLAQWQRDPADGVYDPQHKEDLWPPDHANSGPRWGMVIDLEACTGCSGCVIACQAENNIPVVGKDEVRRNREMHWIRIDRYYTETAAGQLEVAYQPMLCQQCGNAPCETVCPVLATVHSEDGLNQQVYNRCIGTRYCANNCPYKGRRFNWFEYAREDRLQNLVLNPDVTVRSRGVMEKCTFCVQRIQEAKIEAKRQGRRVEDGEVKTACQQSCPANAIAFGDLNDPNSRVSQMMNNPRRYRLLAELNVQPSIGYLTIVRNRDEEEVHRG